LLHSYSRTTAAPSCATTKQKLHIAYFTSWHNSIFDYELSRTLEAEPENP